MGPGRIGTWPDGPGTQWRSLSVTHKQIWAPWRLKYVQAAKQESPHEEEEPELLPGADPGCFLCRAAAESADLRSRHVVHRSARTVVVLNRYPYNNGHLLIAPRRHQGRLKALTSGEQLELSETISGMIDLLEEVLAPEGFNVGLNLGLAAGAGLPGHLHWHVVPRWNGDTNFMPALASVKVIPQSLDALWEALADRLSKQ